MPGLDTGPHEPDAAGQLQEPAASPETITRPTAPAGGPQLREDPMKQLAWIAAAVLGLAATGSLVFLAWAAFTFIYGD